LKADESVADSLPLALPLVFSDNVSGAFHVLFKLSAIIIIIINNNNS
jgi:hypothetical protein